MLPARELASLQAMTEGCAPLGKLPSEVRRKGNFSTLYSNKILIKHYMLTIAEICV